MGCDAACVDTMGMLMKSWITPHLFRIQLTGTEWGYSGRVSECVCVFFRDPWQTQNVRLDAKDQADGDYEDG